MAGSSIEKQESDPVVSSELSKPVKRKGMEVVVFVGTFDPIHLGHCEAAARCLELGADEVVFVPNPKISRKARASPRLDRVAMCELMVQNIPGMNVFRADPTEYMASSSTNWSLRKLITHIQKLYQTTNVGELCGSDIFNTYPPEDHPGYFFGQSIYVALRPPMHSVPDNVPNSVIIGRTCNYSSSKIRRALEEGFPDNEVAVLGLSQPVINYIKAHNLYTPS
eukprot:TRINITY_DN15314_c0_g1_i1.p1 TRINITY_DN15314_c0_g1~~TRINITY_DN15314_c0_g1_i1.p1  ORF type:complete len:223 (+),score=32.67 TRINITY_DN15314_c0_g1_i1:53-721(+)